MQTRLLGGRKLPAFDWEAPRAREGYYRVRAGTAYAVARARAFAPRADLLECVREHALRGRVVQCPSNSLLWELGRRNRLGTALGVRQEQLPARAARPHRDLARHDGLDVAQRLGQVLARRDEDAVPITGR